MSQQLKPWFRARIEEQLLIALAVPLYLVQPVSQVIETLINEVRRLGFSGLRGLLVIRAAINMREQVSSVVRGRLASIIESMVNSERLGVDPSISVLHALRELDDSLRALGNEYRDFVVLLDMLVILTLVIMPLVVVMVGQALGIPVTQYLALNYAAATPMALLLTWNLDPGLLPVDKGLIMDLGVSVVPSIPIYVITHSVALAWLASSTVFLVLTVRWYVDYVRDLSMLGRKSVESIMRASTSMRGGGVGMPRNWLWRFINEYSRVIAVTGMGRSDVLSVAITAITHVMNALRDSRRVGVLSSAVSVSFVVLLMVVMRMITAQTQYLALPATLLLPTAILGGFFSGYVLDSFVTGIYATIPTVLTYLVLTMH